MVSETLLSVRRLSKNVRRGDVLARILHPFDGSVLEEVLSPVDGTVFFAHNKPLDLQHGIIFRII